MKAISLWRPWPWAFFNGAKRVENRSWAPPQSIIGEWVAMHAAQRFDNAALLNIAKLTRLHVPINNHPTGIVGAMHVVGAFHLKTGKWVGVVEPADLVSPYAFGPWCWVVDAVIEMTKPLPCKGKQGLWTVPPEFEAEVRRHLPSAMQGAHGT